MRGAQILFFGTTHRHATLATLSVNPCMHTCSCFADITRLTTHSVNPCMHTCSCCTETTHRHATLATLSVNRDTPGFPNASIVEFIVNEKGLPVLAVSGLSLHTAGVCVYVCVCVFARASANMLANSLVALTVSTPEATRYVQMLI